MNGGTPYLSVVTTARHDDHGGNLLARMQVFVDALIAQCERHRLPAELIVVEWNPTPDRPPLYEALRWPAGNRFCSVRFVRVPAEVHSRYRFADVLPLYQMIAKNAGIRRAQGEFILATNIDVVFSTELMAWLATRPLERCVMYRLDRYDAMSGVPVGAPVDDQLAYCSSHLIRLNAREGTFRLTAEGARAPAEHDIVSPASGIAFGRGWFPVEDMGAGPLFRGIETEAELHLPANASAGAPLRLAVAPGPSAGGDPVSLRISDDRGAAVLHETVERRRMFSLRLPEGTAKLRLLVEGGGRPVACDARIINLRVLACDWERPAIRRAVKRGTPSLRLWVRFQNLITTLAYAGHVKLTIPLPAPLHALVRWYFEAGGFTGLLQGQPRRKIESAAPLLEAPAHTSPPYLHTNGCGDFTLLAKEHWFDLRAYPEFDMFSMHIDALFCYAAHHGGARERILEDPMRVYHIEHAAGSGWTPEGQARLFARIASKGLPMLDYQDVAAAVNQMRRFNAPVIYNHENWGLADVQLPEVRPAG